VALWDLRGKHLGIPVWKLLGASRNKVPAYASALLWKDDIRDLAHEAALHIDHGFRRVKMRLGRSEEYDTSAVRAVRAAVGAGHDVMVDASMRYEPEDALRMEPALRDADVFWWEEPFQPEDLDRYASLQARTPLSLAAGENEFGLPGFRELVAKRAVSIVQPDVSRGGGITEVRRIGEMAAAAGVRVATHTWSDSVAIIANAHVVAAMPNGLTVEVDQTGNPFVDDLLVDPLRIVDGLLDLGDQPGLGIDVRPELLARYRMRDPIRPPDGNYSDMVFGQGTLQPAPSWQPTS
jgi:D-galactarolactone cycloisomerase